MVLKPKSSPGHRTTKSVQFSIGFFMFAWYLCYVFHCLTSIYRSCTVCEPLLLFLSVFRWRGCCTVHILNVVAFKISPLKTFLKSMTHTPYTYALDPVHIHLPASTIVERLLILTVSENQAKKFLIKARILWRGSSGGTWVVRSAINRSRKQAVSLSAMIHDAMAAQRFHGMHV
jgi:hypothetical protein